MRSTDTLLGADIRHALDRFHECATDTLQRLTSPYVERAAADKQALLGQPLPWIRTPFESPLRGLADLVMKMGGGAAPLFTLLEDDAALDSLVQDYVAGKYAMNLASTWIEEVSRFRAKIETDVAAAREALPRWSRLDPSKIVAPPEAGDGTPDILTPEQAVKLMGGSISVAGLRARIRKGAAGPWRRVGGKLQIRASAFLGFYAAQPGEAQALAQRRGQVMERLADQHPPRRKGAPRLGAGGGAAPSGGNTG